MDHSFQVDLRGIIEILSEHLYSGPQVFLRELLQNAVDAVHAREKLGETFTAQISMELAENAAGRPTLTFTDSGIGLTEAEVHEFLATIGKSSKREVGAAAGASDFIGQFGIGLLSCFVVSDEIHLLSRSAKTGQVVEFRGSPTGRYSVRALVGPELDTLLAGQPLDTGSRVLLTAKPEMTTYFAPDTLLELAQHYGGLLPYPITLHAEEQLTPVNPGGAVWRREYETPEARRAALLDFGSRVLGRAPFDVVDLKTRAGALDGVALVLPWTPSLAAKTGHVAYLKNMLLSEDAEDLAPEWAFFVKLVVNSGSLKPTASREGFAEDGALQRARSEIGETLQQYLATLSEAEPTRFRELLRLHDVSLRALALENDELCSLFVTQLEFETGSGPMTLQDYREHLGPAQGGVIYYTSSVEQFRQMARVAGAQGFNLINGGYIYASELLERYAQLSVSVKVERIEADFFANRFEELSITERNSSFAFLHAAERTLEPLGCGTELLHFRPAELPTLFVTSAQQRFVRSIEAAQEVASDLFSGVLDAIRPTESPARQDLPSHTGQLYFNMSNPLVRRLAALGDSAQVTTLTEVLYVQSLLLAQHPLSARDLKALTGGLEQLIALGLGATEARRELH
jgi:molecular chaperone HtpG